MAVKLHLAFLFLLVGYTAHAQQDGVFDVTTYGAKSDGSSDISKAFLDAFKAACAMVSPSKVLIPKGTFLLGKLDLVGPCKGPIEVQVEGTLQALQHAASFKGVDSWVTFKRIDLLTLSGGGVFDGKGTAAWAANDCSKNKHCDKLPVSLRFNFITNGLVRDITSLDSKNFHVNLLGCKNLTFDHVHITAPEHSVNTDGIHMGRSTGINITDTIIATGDDCVSIGDGTQQLTVSRVTCGPGHGISIGSLGRYPKEEPVIGITIVNCTIKSTMNGVRIKSWPSSPAHGIVSDVRFEDIIMENVSNPILIDQEYCPYNLCKLDTPSLVKISQVTIKNIRGTSATPETVKLACSRGVPCENVQISDIDLKYTGNRGPAAFSCSNVKPVLSGTLNPPACST